MERSIKIWPEKVVAPISSTMVVNKDNYKRFKLVTIIQLNTASCENHCLHHILPVAKSTKYALRVVGQGLSLEHVLSELHYYIRRHLLIGWSLLIAINCVMYLLCMLYFLISFYFHFIFICLSRIWRDFYVHNNKIIIINLSAKDLYLLVGLLNVSVMYSCDIFRRDSTWSCGVWTCISAADDRDINRRL